MEKINTNDDAMGSLNAIFSYKNDFILEDTPNENESTLAFLNSLTTIIANVFLDKNAQDYFEKKEAVKVFINNVWYLKPELSFHEQNLPEKFLERMSHIFVAFAVSLIKEKKNIFTDLNKRKILSSLLTNEASIKNAFFKLGRLKQETFQKKYKLINSSINSNTETLDLTRVIKRCGGYSFDVLTTIMNNFRKNKNSIFEQWLITECSKMLSSVEEKNSINIESDSEMKETSSEVQILTKQFNTWHLSEPKLKDFIVNQKDNNDPFRLIMDHVKASKIKNNQGEDRIGILNALHDLLKNRGIVENRALSILEVILQKLNVEKSQMKKFLKDLFNEGDNKLKAIWLACVATNYDSTTEVNTYYEIFDAIFKNKINYDQISHLDNFQMCHPLVRSAFCLTRTNAEILEKGLIRLSLFPELNPGTIILGKSSIFQTIEEKTLSHYEKIYKIIDGSEQLPNMDTVISRLYKKHAELESQNIDHVQMSIDDSAMNYLSNKYYCLETMIRFSDVGYNNEKVAQWITNEIKNIFDQVQNSPHDKPAMIIFYCLFSVLARNPELQRQVQEAIVPVEVSRNMVKFN